MTLTAQKDTTLQDDFVDVKYRELTPVIHQIFQLCESERAVLLCDKDGTTHHVDLHDVLYIEWIDNKCCVYTKSDVFIIASSLTQLEESLRKRQFIRISKMCLANLFKINSVSNSLNMRLTAEMNNGERVVVSRHYRGELLSAIHTLAREVAK